MNTDYAAYEYGIHRLSKTRFELTLCGMDFELHAGFVIVDNHTNYILMRVFTTLMIMFYKQARKDQLKQFCCFHYFLDRQLSKE